MNLSQLYKSFCDSFKTISDSPAADARILICHCLQINQTQLALFPDEEVPSEKLEELDSRFHTCIYNACESRMLAKILSDLHRVIGAYRRRSLDNPDRVGKSVAEHREIFEAIASKDAARAEELMSAHIDAALTNLLSLEK